MLQSLTSTNDPTYCNSTLNGRRYCAPTAAGSATGTVLTSGNVYSNVLGARDRGRPWPHAQLTLLSYQVATTEPTIATKLISLTLC
jgi:hypothetical protein